MRSKWKIPFIDYVIFRKVKSTLEEKNTLTLRARNSTITPYGLNVKTKIYNGMKYASIKIKEKHLGYKYGHFTITKRRCEFRRQKTKKQSNGDMIITSFLQFCKFNV